MANAGKVAMAVAMSVWVTFAGRATQANRAAPQPSMQRSEDSAGRASPIPRYTGPCELPGEPCCQLDSGPPYCSYPLKCNQYGYCQNP
jgi:hypothetical protein